MIHELKIKRLSALSFFKLCLIGNTISFVMVWILLTIPALFGSPLVRWEDEYITEPMAVFAGPLVVAAAGLLLSMALSLLTYSGLLVFSCYKNISLGYLPQTT